jgi:hypothetical protein
MNNLIAISALHFDRLRAEGRRQIDALRRGMKLGRITEAELLAQIAELDRVQFGGAWRFCKR